MKTEPLIQRIKRDTWWSEEAPGVPMFCQWIQQFVQQSKYWHPTLPTIIICFFKGEFIFEETPEGEKLKVWEYVLNQYRRTPKVQKLRYQAWRKIQSELIAEGEWFIKRQQTLSQVELAGSLKRFCELVKEHWRYTWVQESADVFSTYELPKLLQAELPTLTLSEHQDLAITLSAPLQLSFIEQEHRELLRLGLRWYPTLRHTKTLAGAPRGLQAGLERLTKDYVWILSNYRQGKPLTRQILWQQIRYDCLHKPRPSLVRELKSLNTKVARVTQAQGRLHRKFKLTPKLTAAFSLLSWWATWIDERKRLALIANWYLEHYAQELSRRWKKPVWQIKFLTLDEQLKVFKSGWRMNAGKLKARRKLSAWVVIKQGKGLKQNILTGRQAQVLHKLILEPKTTRELRGMVASAPVEAISGRVQIVLDPHRDKFTPGRILVTTMTRPDFIPFLRHAKAIITDEGGITSHAAIISRELRIPCIIGTRQATKILKNGNRVKIDLRVGLVRKSK